MPFTSCTIIGVVSSEESMDISSGSSSSAILYRNFYLKSEPLELLVCYFVPLEVFARVLLKYTV